jgi:hypothetical protein
MTDLDDDLDLTATLEAERGIRRTFFRFFRLMDTMEWERAGRECFATDAVLKNDALPGGMQLRSEGRTDITAALAAGQPVMQMVAHVAGQSFVDCAEPGRPRLTAYVTAWHWFADRAREGELRPADWTIVTLVEDEYVPVEGEWLIERRTITPAAGMVAAGTLPTP